MRRLPNIVGLILGVLFSTALALSPAVAFAKALDVGVAGDHGTAAHQTTPCDMPCDGCQDTDASPACMSACSGLIAAMNAIEPLRQPAVMFTRATPLPKVQRDGRDREPDKPPPKHLLA